MPDEHTRKKTALEYCRRVNAGDVEGVLALFTGAPHVEDPVGGNTFTDRDGYREHIAGLVAARVHETPGTPVAGLDDEHVLLPISVVARPPQLPAGKIVRMSVIALMLIGPDGLIARMRVFSGATDMTVVEATDGVESADGTGARGPLGSEVT